MKQEFTTQPVAASSGVDPEFCNFAGLLSRFGIGRSLGYTLIERGDIRSLVLRRKGCIKGKRLISIHSVRQFLEKQSDDVHPRLRAVCKKAKVTFAVSISPLYFLSL
jgi:hypothetical protein